MSRTIHLSFEFVYSSPIKLIVDLSNLVTWKTLAYNLGLASMEADTWLVPPSWFDHGKPSSRPTPEAPLLKDVQEKSLEEPQLYVGHTPIDLRREGTLKEVYLDRIWDILERLNEGRGPGSSSPSGSGSGAGSGPANGEEGKNERETDEGRGNGRGVVGEKSWDWNGVFTDRGVKDQTLLFYIDVVSSHLLTTLQARD